MLSSLIVCFCRLFQLLAEARALQQIGISIPSVANNLLAQEDRMKQFRQHLELVLEVLDSAVSQQDPLMDGLFTQINHGVKR